MAKTSKGVILSQASQIKSDYSFALIKATADNKSLVQDASSAELKVNALVEYSKDSQWDPKKLTSLGFPAGCFLIVDLRGQDIHAADLITNLALVRQYGYQAGVIDDLSTLDDIKVLKTNQIYLINSGKANDDQDASLNGDEITDDSGKLAVGMSVKWQRDYTNVDVSGDHAGFVGMGQDTLLKGGNAFGYSTNGRDFNAVITPKGLIFRRPDAERMWRLLKPNEIADINSTVGDKVKKEVDSATAEIPAAVSAANSAVSAAESAVAASKVNSDAIVAQSEAISEAKSALDSATAEIQQTAANAASDAAKIRADVAQVQNEVDTAKAANSASVEVLKSDVSAAKQDLADVHDSLGKAQSAIEQNQKLINDSVTKITSDVSATKQDLANVHDSLTKAQAAAEQNQKAINDSIAEINANVDATNQDLAGVRKDLTKAQSDITANQKSINDNVAQINADITQDRKDIADVRQGLTKAQSDITANQKAVNDNVAQINADITQDRKDIASAQQANADTAKQLDTYSKQATEQGKTIKTIQDKQDGFTATLADVQGNVSQVSDKVDGLSASLKDAQDNVASVKAQADQLSATLTDHAKSIATLTASAKELSSTLEDADGRLSKVEQTAKTNSSTFADVQGDLSQVKQDATALTSTLKDAQGNISTLQQKADSVSAQLASAQGDIASLQTDVDGVKATLASHDKTIHTLQLDSKSLKDSMTNAQGDISTLQKSATSLDSEMKDHAGRLSKVEQSATTQATTLSDLQGNLSQVKQTADGIETTLKNAQGDIDQIKQTAKGTSEQLADVKGNVTNIQKDVDGLKQTTADNAGNIHTLQSDSKSLKDSMADAQGDISTLKKTSTDVTTELKDHAGRLSKVEQTASEQSTTLSDVQGNLSQVKQTADGLVTTLKDAQGNIDQIKQTAKGTSEQLSNVQGDVTNIQKDVNGLKQTTADNAGNIHTLQSDSKTLKDNMTDAQGNISSLQKSSTKLNSEFSSQDGRLSKVEQTAKEHTSTISDLGDKLSNLKVGTSNLLHNSDTFVGWNKYSTASVSKDKYLNGNIITLSPTKIGADGVDSNLDGPYDNQPVTWTVYAKADNDGDKLHTELWGGGGITDQPLTTDWQVYKFTGQRDARNHSFYLWGCQGNKGNIYVALPYAVVGNTIGSWLPNPADLATLTQVKQTANGIETTLKSAQGDIDQIKQTAKGTSEQLADVQGNVTNIQKDIDGLKQTTADNAGNIHTLQSDSKSLHDSMQDAQGDISTLKKTSTDVTSELKDHAGRISKTEQTASTLVNELADQQGHLNRVEQKATGTEQTVANQQGQINNIKTDAAGIHETLTGQGNQIANINVTLTGLNSKYEGVSGDLNNLKSQAQWVTVTSAVDLNNVKTPCHEFLKGTVTNAPNEVAWWYLTVEGLDDGNRVTQTVIADQSNNRYTRRWADGWSAWVKDATQTDITSLSNRITTNSTQITQNKQAIAIKADQSTVDNLSGEVSQNSAQLKVQADQISSKVSSTDFKTLNDKVNGMQIGTSNLLHHSDTFDGWSRQSTVTISSEKYLNGCIAVLATNGSGSNNLASFLDGPYDDQPVTWTVWAKADNAGDRLHTELWGGGGLTDQPLTTNWKLYKFTGHRNINYHDLFFWGVAGNKGNIYVALPFAVVGNTVGTWSPNPSDTITAIQKNATAIDQTNQKISLKADQTEVDKIKNTATQNSSRLDVMAGQISSKVTATDVNNIVNGKGYATTSTVQSLITQKAGTINESITNLDAKYSAKDGVNLVRASGFHNVTLDDLKNSGWSLYDMVYINKNGGSNKTGSLVIDAMTSTSGLKDAVQTVPLEPDTDYTLSFHLIYAGIASGKSFNAWSYVVEEDSNGKAVSPYVDNNHPMANSDDRKQNTRTFHTSKDTHQGVLFLRAMAGTKIELEEVKLEHGSVATPWTPAPSDNATVTQVQSLTASIDGLQSTVANKADKSQITQLSNVIQSKVSSSDFNNLRKAIDLQTLDSADINNMKTNGHYFVHNLANNPVGGWVYVDVTGNGNDRIRQDVYQDIGNKHKYRRWFGNWWTNWSEGATESEITQLRDDINLRVKSGDLLSQINLTAGNTLIQSNKIYLDSSSTVFSGKAFIPSAAIVNLDVAKLNAGTINTDRIHIGDDSVYLSVKNNYLRLDGSNTKDKYQLRLTGNDIEFADNDSSNWEYRIQHGITKYQTDEDGLDFDVYSKRGGANHTVMAVSDAGVMISPSLFFQTDGIDSSNWMGFTRNTVDGNSSVSFHTWDDNNEGFHVDCGARFMNYVYINGYARAQGWLTNSTLSKKTNIRKLDLQTALDKIRQDDQYLYEYKRNVAKGIHDPQASFIIDDIHDVAQYSVPREFIDQSGEYREPNVELAYLVAAFQALDKQVQSQQAEIKKLKEQLNND